MPPPIGGYLTVMSARNLVTGCKFWGIYLAVARYLCYIVFTGKYGNIDFKMNVTYLRSQILCLSVCLVISLSLSTDRRANEHARDLQEGSRERPQEHKDPTRGFRPGGPPRDQSGGGRGRQMMHAGRVPNVFMRVPNVFKRV